MGRAKLNLELITKEKSRNITFKKRKEGLIRKMHEFTTLCDVSACMIIYGPKQENGVVQPDIWPQNIQQVQRVIDIYKSKSKDSGNKTYGLSDFLQDRKRKIEDELSKQRKKNMESIYPTWPDFMNFMTEAQLRELAAALRDKADYVKSRLEFLRRNKQGLNMMDFRLPQSQIYNNPGVELEQAIASHLNPIELHVPIHHYQYPTIDHQNSMMMLFMNDHNDQCLQFGGAAAATGSNLHCASYNKRQVFYESSGRGLLDPNPLGRYYGPAMPIPVSPPVFPYVQIMPAVGLTQGQLQFPVRENGGGGGDEGHEEFVSHQYQTNHNRARYYDLKDGF